MAVTVDVLKLTQTQGVVAVRGTAATGTIALATTLKKSSETQSSPKANIKAIHWTLSSGASAKVNRNSKVMQVLKECGIRQASFSKYACGATLLNQQLKYNQFKSNMLYLNKIHKDYGVIWNR